MTLQHSIKEFLLHCVHQKNLTLKTIKFYTIDLNQFSKVIDVENKILIDDISKNEIKRFMESLSLLKPKSIKRKMATVKALFNYLEFDDLIKTNPIRKVKIKLKEASVLPNVMDITEIGKILNLLYARKNLITQLDRYTYKEILRNIVVIELLFATGGRVSEIAKLSESSIDLDSGVVVINGKGRKERIVQICNEETLSILRCYKQAWSREIDSTRCFLINRFGNNLSEQSIRSVVKGVSKAAGIKRNITPHVFRHSFATLLLEREVDIKYIQSLLGHSSIMTTQIYTHVSKSKQKQLLTEKHPRKEILISPSLNDG